MYTALMAGGILIQAPVRFSPNPAMHCNVLQRTAMQLETLCIIHYTLVATRRAHSGHNLLPLAIWPKICISARHAIMLWTKSFNAHILPIIWKIEAVLNLIGYTLTKAFNYNDIQHNNDYHHLNHCHHQWRLGRLSQGNWSGHSRPFELCSAFCTILCPLYCFVYLKHVLVFELCSTFTNLVICMVLLSSLWVVFITNIINITIETSITTVII